LGGWLGEGSHWVSAVVFLGQPSADLLFCSLRSGKPRLYGKFLNVSWFWWSRSLSSLRKNSVLHLILGGAAVYRCDNWLIFIDGFSR
jgi:hypothetical protein